MSAKKHLFFDILKVNEEERTVEGIASTEALDSDGEVMEYEAVKDALADYMKFGTLREMHQLKAAGNVIEARADDATRTIHIKAEVVDDQAWEKVKKKVYKGFSIGGRSLARLGNRIKKLLLREISLVDRPSNPEAMFSLVKVDGGADEGEVLDLAADPISLTEIKKGMGQVSRLASLYQDLEWLRVSVQAEEEFEGDTASRLPALLNEICTLLGNTLLEMAAEEVTELQANYVQPKAAASKGTAMKLTKAQAEDKMKALKKAADDAFDKAIAKAADDSEDTDVDKAMADIFSPSMCVPVQKAEKDGDIAKALRAVASKDEKAGETNDIVKALGAAVLALNEKLEKALSQVAPPKAAAKNVIEKAEDSAQVEEKAVADDIAKAQKDKDPIAVLRAIRAQGGRLVQPGEPV